MRSARAVGAGALDSEGDDLPEFGRPAQWLLVAAIVSCDRECGVALVLALALAPAGGAGLSRGRSRRVAPGSY